MHLKTQRTVSVFSFCENTRSLPSRVAMISAPSIHGSAFTTTLFVSGRRTQTTGDASRDDADADNDDDCTTSLTLRVSAVGAFEAANVDADDAEDDDGAPVRRRALAVLAMALFAALSTTSDASGNDDSEPTRSKLENSPPPLVLFFFAMAVLGNVVDSNDVSSVFFIINYQPSARLKNDALQQA